MSIATLFDYGALDVESRIVVQQKTGEIKDRVKRSRNDILEIGERLIDIKERLGHGSFGRWLEVEFGWTDRTAQGFMNVAVAFKSEIISDLDMTPTAMQSLAAPSVPVPARQEAIEAARNGQHVGTKQAEAIIEKHKPAPADDDTEEDAELRDPDTAPEMESQEPEWEEETEETEAEEVSEDDQETEADEVESPTRPGNSGFALRTEGLPVPAESQPTREALHVMLQTIGSSISSLDAPKGRHSYGWGGFESVVKPLSRVEIRHVDGRIEHFIERLQEYRKIIKGLVKRKVT